MTLKYKETSNFAINMFLFSEDCHDLSKLSKWMLIRHLSASALYVLLLCVTSILLHVLFLHSLTCVCLLEWAYISVRLCFYVGLV